MNQEQEGAADLVLREWYAQHELGNVTMAELHHGVTPPLFLAPGHGGGRPYPCEAFPPYSVLARDAAPLRSETFLIHLPERMLISN